MSATLGTKTKQVHSLSSLSSEASREGGRCEEREKGRGGHPSH
jgi:hypothetical protein